MKRNVTIGDIAAAAGVSLSTAHLALSGKKGIRPETKARILEQARRLDYHCNSVASSLKRGVTQIAVVLPAQGSDGGAFYEPIWEGVRAYCASAHDFQLEMVEFPYYGSDTVSVPGHMIDALSDQPKLAGAVILGALEREAEKKLREIPEMPVVLVNGDAPGCGRICCVQAENFLLGRTMGELLALRIREPGSVLVCAGDLNTSADNESVKGLEEYLSGVPFAEEIHKIHHQNDMEHLYLDLCRELTRQKDLRGCCSVTARGSVQLARALRETGRAGTLCAIGSDAFPENIENLKNGVFQNLMFKNPFQQGWFAAEQLFKYIFSREMPKKMVIRVKSEAIFQSSVSMYETPPQV